MQLNDRPDSSYFKYLTRICSVMATLELKCLPTFLQVGMSIDSQLFINRFPTILGSLVLLIGGKTLLVTGVGRFFGLSTVAAARAGLLLAPGGEFAFVAFGEAVNQASLCNLELNLVFINEFSCTTYFVLKIVSFVFSLQLSASCSTSV